MNDVSTFYLNPRIVWFLLLCLMFALSDSH